MRRIVLALPLVLAAWPAWALDLLMKYDTEAHLLAVAQYVEALYVAQYVDPKLGVVPAHINMVQRLSGGWGEYAVTPVFQWFNPTGGTYVDSFGNTQPVMAADGFRYRVLRWNGPVARLANFITTHGGTIVTDGNGVTTVTAGPVTMTSPLPADVPVTF